MNLPSESADLTLSSDATLGPDAQTNASRAALEGFIALIAKGDIRGAFEQYTTETYTQHMEGVSPGREGAIAYLEDEIARGGTASLSGFVAEGNMVAIHMRQKFTDGSPDREVIEFWRVENGRLAEHWGASQPIPVAADAGAYE